MSRRLRRIVLGLGLVLALGLLVGAVSAGKLSDTDDEATATTTAAAAAPVVSDPYPLSTQQTPKEVQLVIFERAYSECATTDLPLLASKYKAEDRSKRGIAAVVGRAWTSYFKAGSDALADGRDGCLQGQKDRRN